MLDQQEILHHYALEGNSFDLQAFGDGLIHKTYILKVDQEPKYILQQINTHVFKSPASIENNLFQLQGYLKNNQSTLFLPLPLANKVGKLQTFIGDEVFRITAYVTGSHALTTCTQPEQAYEAAYQFGQFTASFNHLPVAQLKATIPDFHNLSFRWKQFEQAVAQGNPDRKHHAKNEIAFLLENKSIVTQYEKICSSSLFKHRVTHHDTKISNVLFNESGKGICVIDLDTVMGGLMISDLGDMFRTYLSPGNEEETDLQKVEVRTPFYKAIVEGYLEKMADQLSVEEKEAIPFAGEFLIYMQALRFLTDFLNNDCYYGITYELNNFNRTINQLHLLEAYRKSI